MNSTNTTNKQGINLLSKFMLFCLFSVAQIGATNAQITYTSISFPQAGDVLTTATTIDSALTITPPSATATSWDFSNWVAITSTKDTIEPASNGLDALLFPDADILQPLIGNIGTSYTDVTATQIERIGGGLELFGISLVNFFDDTHITQIVPLNYGDTASDTYLFNYGAHIDSVPFLRQIIDSLVSGLPFGISPDSLRISLDGDEVRVVDAWGTCTMAHATYDVLRQKVTSNFDMLIEARVDVPFFGVQWVDVTSFLPLPFPLNGTVVRYDYLAEGEKQPVARMTMDSSESNVSSVEYMDTTVNNPPNTIDVRYLEDELNASIFPNPARELINIQMAAADVPTQGYRLHVIDLLGRIALTENNIFNENHQINVSSISNGHYVVVLQGDDGTILKRQQIEIMR